MNRIYIDLPSWKYPIKCPCPMEPIGITIHNTAMDAPAKNEVAYMHSNANKVSYHFAVDDVDVVQGLPLGRMSWHAGDGRGKGNMRTISIEICYSRSGGTRFIQAEMNAARLVALLLKQYGWGIDRVYKHQDWSGKYCPHRTLDLGWERFLDMVRVELGQAKALTPKTVQSIREDKLIIDGSWGKATTLATQKKLNTGYSDGILSGQYRKAVGKSLFAVHTSGWQFSDRPTGSMTVRAIQKLVGVTADGIMGRETVKAMQRFLGVTVDGCMGTATVKAWQKYLNSI